MTAVLLRFSFVLLAMCALTGVARAQDRVQFNFQIKPLLSDRCYACHGPDERARKAKLRLDTREGAFGKTKKGKSIIVPGKPDESELVARITSGDPDEKMPPPDSHLALSSEEIVLLKRWIAEGASWESHWAFVAPVKPRVPQIRDPSWAKNDIDRFIAARFEKDNLKPSPEASREKLIRRASFDLTGLPPTLKEVDDFLADKSANAYEKVVDRLLASPAYGERLAVDWLDAARYADTHGYQADRYRPIWPWRDWVVKAFNENLPYNEFIKWQLAGDLLPSPTKEQQLATAFNRIHMQTEEGGSVEEEFRTVYVVDRVNTMGTAFMALTFECSRCHDHKFDPISQKDFYSLYSFFNNIDESGQTSYFTDSTPVPALPLSDEATDRKLTGLRTQIREMEFNRAKLIEHQQGVFEDWLKEGGHEPAIKGLIGHFSFESITNNTTPNLASGGKAAQLVESPKQVEGNEDRGLLLSGDNGVTMPGLGQFSRIDPFSIGLWIQSSNTIPRGVVFHRSQAALDAGSRGYEMVIENGHVSLGLHHMWPNNSLKIMSRALLPTNEWVQLTMVYDGSSRAQGLTLYWNGRAAEVDVIRDNLTKDITYERNDPTFAIGYRFRDNGFKGGRVDEFRIYNRALTPLEAGELGGLKSLQTALATPAQDRDLLAYYAANFSPVVAKYDAALHDLRSQESKLIQSIPEIMTMREMTKPRQAHVLKRGAYDAPGDPVSMDTPRNILPFDEKLPRNRLGLAEWLTSPKHPLTARVTVNRFWQLMFGQGIVATSDNFGSQGELPTHPQLLDWLAVSFQEHGWDVKWLVREMALSATYRVSSQPTPETTTKDPENKLLTHAPRYRLPAEMLRDQALAASGLLAATRGGPPVKPYQPEGLWEEKSGAKYEQDKGEGLHRRSLYSFWKRTVPPPALIAFDAAERNTCIVRRQTTSTPLQALVLLNDVQYVEASRVLAERTFQETKGSLDDEIGYMFRLLTSRRPTSKEVTVLRKLFEEQVELYSKDKASALQLITSGDKTPAADVDPIKLAAGTILASTLLNYDETVTKR